MQTHGIVAGLEGRYATALFELARDHNMIDDVGSSLARLRQALRTSEDFATLTRSPLIEREEALRGVMATADALEIDGLTRNFLGVLARNRRLAALPGIIAGYRKLAAAWRGETTAEVTSAHALSDEQMQQLRDRLRAGLHRDVDVDLTVDPSILGGLIVRIGSRQIDSSLRTKLAGVARAMKG